MRRCSLDLSTRLLYCRFRIRSVVKAFVAVVAARLMTVNTSHTGIAPGSSNWNWPMDATLAAIDRACLMITMMMMEAGQCIAKVCRRKSLLQMKGQPDGHCYARCHVCLLIYSCPFILIVVLQITWNTVALFFYDGQRSSSGQRSKSWEGGDHLAALGCFFVRHFHFHLRPFENSKSPPHHISVMIWH